ncbi:MAG: WhiB family transcriptional regulator [Pseudonocardia sp.]
MAGAQDWRHDAACIEVDTELFFPEPGEPTAPAKRICAGCPVRAECLSFALARREPHGVFGGLSVGERRHLLRQSRTAVHAGGSQTDAA